jgi:hypothetical protein
MGRWSYQAGLAGLGSVLRRVDAQMLKTPPAAVAFSIARQARATGNLVMGWQLLPWRWGANTARATFVPSKFQLPFMVAVQVKN